jgi:outer membrane protein OmpA-like peptidoglycan-associated protein
MKFVLAGLLSSVSFFVVGQNLVPNSGFEAFVKCPAGHLVYGDVFSLPGWFSPNIGTPDYFNTCSKRESHPSINWAGRCEGYSGNAYAGIISFMTNRPYREYLGVQLTAPLDSGVTYSLQFSFMLSSYSKISSGHLAMLVSDKKLKVTHDKPMTFTPTIMAMPDSGIVKQTGGWQTMSGDYVAKGGEQYVYIGNFSTAQAVPFYKIKFGGNHEPMLSTASYYYIDDVVVQPQVKFIPDIPIVVEDTNPFETDSLIVLKNVQFAYNSVELNNISEVELSRLIKFLQANPRANIEILGHTDDQGSDQYNNQLSLRRARSVVKFLIESGINKNRMKASGFGKTLPLINSTDEMARSINRRVEVKLLN